MTLLSPHELASLERLALATRARLLGFFAGEHRSKRFGSSLDFADHREYKPGDDFRSIDAALSARMDRLYLKLYEAEEDVPLRIILDASASMAFGSPSKFELARKLAAGFSHIAFVQADRVRIYLARAGGADTSRWFRGKDDTFEVMSWLERAEPGGDAGLGEAVRAIREEGRAGVLVVISDLLEDAWEESVRRFAPPGEAAVAHVLSAEEFDPALDGDLTLVDAETGNEVEVSITAEVLAGYRARLDEWIERVRSTCTSRGIPYALARSSDEVLDLFTRTLRRAQVVRS